MDLNNYQRKSKETAIYPGQGSIDGLTYVTLGLCGEAAEIANKVKKILRDDNGFYTDDRLDEIAAELGDVLWYVAQVATELGVELSGVALENLTKLYARQQSNTLSGSGDSR